LVDNIGYVVEEGSSTQFWRNPWMEQGLLDVRLRRLYELTENKLVSVAEMFSLSWGMEGETWN